MPMERINELCPRTPGTPSDDGLIPSFLLSNPSDLTGTIAVTQLRGRETPSQPNLKVINFLNA